MELMATTVMCASCGGVLSEARASLGMVTCSGPCNARRRRETGLVDGVEGEWMAAVENRVTRVLDDHKSKGRHPEWRRGFTAGLVVGLVVGLVLPLVALLGEPARADGPAPAAPGETCEDVVSSLQGLVAAMEAEAGDYSARNIRLTLRNKRLAARVDRKADTIERLRDRLRGTR